MQARGRLETQTRGILWDGFGLQTLHSGVGRHAWDLLLALDRIGCSPGIIPSIPQIDSNFAPWVQADRQILPKSRLKPWSLFWSSRWLQSSMLSPNSVRLVHGLSNYNLPAKPGRRVRTVLTLHDLIPILNRENVATPLSLFLRYQLPKAIERADAIICVSGWTERTLAETYPQSRGRTLVIPNGWAEFQEVEPREKTGQSLLTVSRFESYKRLSWILPILAQLPPQIRWTVVTDRKGRQLLSAAEDPRLILKSQIDDEELLRLHRSADVYVHPSLWEGFCLPAAASISQAVPVVHTSGSGIDEVVGEAGISLSPLDDTKKWAEAILCLLADPDTRQRCRSRSRSAKSWDEVAASTLELYDKLEER